MSNPPDDSALWIAQAVAGDREAFSRLMELHQSRLHAQALAFVRDPTAAQELVQETMIEAWKSLPRFDGSCRFFTWLYVILLRRRWRRFTRPARFVAFISPLTSSWAEHVAPTTHDPAVRADESAILRTMIEALPAAQREVVRLRFYAQADEAEIAAALGIAHGTVKSRLHHALAKLRGMTDKVNQLRP